MVTETASIRTFSGERVFIVTTYIRTLFVQAQDQNEARSKVTPYISRMHDEAILGIRETVDVIIR